MNALEEFLRVITAGLTAFGLGCTAAALHDHRPGIALMLAAVAACSGVHAYILDTVAFGPWSHSPPEE